MVRAIAFLGILSLPVWSANGPVLEASAPAIVGSALPAFYNGYLFSGYPRDIVTLFAPDGRSALTLPRIQGRGNGEVHVESVAIDSDGTLAVAWVDRPSAGIDIRDSAGKLVRSIDTGRYLPMHLSFGDHSLWAFGWERDADREWGIPAKDYQAVRKYSMDGKEIGVYLPRSLFPPGLPPAAQRWQERRITITSDRVGIEADSGNVGTQREWVEFDLNGDHLGRWRLDPSDKFPGVAFTSDNQAYVHRFDREAKSWRVFRLNREKSTWEAVSAPNLALYGADGDKLVFADWSGGVMHLSWYPQP
jgi:hypothetical protein